MISAQIMSSAEEPKIASSRQSQLEAGISLLKADSSVPRPYWYEMKTPEFHVEAKRNLKFLQKTCNW